jgi:hypothetical protein
MANLMQKSTLVLSAMDGYCADDITDEAELNDLAKIVGEDQKPIDVAMGVGKQVFGCH